MKQFYSIALFLILIVTTYKGIAQCPANLDFENGTKSGWTCLSGTVTEGVIAVSPGACINPGNKINPPLRDAPYSAIPSVNQQAIMSAAGGVDPNTGLPVVAPGGGNYSLRIGDGTGATDTPVTTPALAVGVSYTIPQITAQNSELTYMYAVVLCESTQPFHPTPEAPRFEIILKDQTGKKIECGSYEVNTSFLPNMHQGAAYTEILSSGMPGTTGIWCYSDWTSVTVNLKSFIGQQVTVEFRVADCNAKAPGGGFQRGGHGAYAYIDMKCGSAETIKIPAICANINEVSLCASAGSNYKWEQLKKITGTMDSVINKSCLKVKTPAIGEIYKLSYKSSSGCDLEVIDTLKGLLVSTVKSVTLCPKYTPNYQLKAEINGTNNVTYSWASIPAGFTSTVKNPVIATPAQNTAYIVNVKDTISGCTTSDTIRIASNCDLHVAVNNPAVCAGNCTTLTSIVTGGVLPYNYTWQPGSVKTASINICPSASSVYTVTVTDSAGTVATATSAVTVNPLPDVKLPPFVTGILNPSSPAFDLTGGSPAGGEYSGNGVIGNKFNPAIAGVGTHIITYTYGNKNGCTKNAVQTIIVSTPSAVIDLSINNGLAVYPNPFTQNITIETSFAVTEHVIIRLINMLGEVVNVIDDATVKGIYKRQVNTASMPAGIYFLSVQTKDKLITNKLIKNN